MNENSLCACWLVYIHSSHFADLSMQLKLCLLGGVMELKEPDATAGSQCSGQPIGSWLLMLMGKGLQMSLVEFLCVSVPES